MARTIAFSHAIEIAAPADEVFSTLADVTSWPAWASNLESFQPMSPGPVTQGSRLLHVSRRGNRRIETSFEVTDDDPPRRFAIASASLRCSFDLSPTPASTNMTSRFEVAASGPAAIMYRLLLRWWAAADLRRFKDFAERRSHS